MGAPVKEGTTNVSVVVKVIDATTGIPDQTLTYTDFALWYRREVDPGSTPLAVQDTFTEVTQTVTGAHVDYGVVHLEEGNYRVDVPDAAFAAGAIAVTVGAVVTSKIVIEAYHPIVAYDPMDTVRMGMTALPNAVVEAAGGLIVSTLGTTDADDCLTATGFATPTNITSIANGASDWNVGKTGYTLTATTGLGAQTANITGNLSGSVGSVTGLTASNLDATVSSRMPTTHLDATAGKLDGVALADTTTTVTNDVGVDEWNGTALSTTNPLPNAAPGSATGLPSVNDVNAQCDQALTDYDAVVPADLPTNFGSMSISVGGVVDADMTAVSTSTTAANNLETLFDSNEGFYCAYTGPRGPGIYVNDAAANTNTANGVDGTIGNPVSTMTAAKSIADSMNMDRFYFVNNTTVTLAATYQEYEFIGLGDNAVQVVNFGDQIVTNSAFYNLTLEGDVSVSTGRAYAENCVLRDESGVGTTTLYLYAKNCGFLDSFQLTANDDHIFEQCYSMVAGNGTPVIDLNSGAGTSVNVRHYSGGIQIDNASGTATMSVETDGQVIIDATCNASFTLTVRGCSSITDNASLSSLTRDAALNKTDLATGVWSADATSYQTQGTFGQAIGDPAADTTTIYQAVATDATGDNVAVDVVAIQTDLDNGTDGLGAIKTDTAAILIDTADMQPRVVAIETDTNELQVDDVPTLIAALQTDLDTLTDATTEPTGVPGVSETLINKVGYLYMALRNQVDVSATKKTFYDDGGVAEWEKDLTDNGTTYSESEGNAI